MTVSLLEQQQLHFVQGLEAIVTLAERQDFPKDINPTNINTYLSSLAEKEPLLYQVLYNDMRGYARAFHQKVLDYKSYFPQGTIQRALYRIAVIPAYLAVETGSFIQKMSAGTIPTNLGAALCMTAIGMITLGMEEKQYALAKVLQLYLIGSLGAFVLPSYVYNRDQRKSSSQFSNWLEERLKMVSSPKHEVLANEVLRYFQIKTRRELATLASSEIEKKKTLEEDLQLFSIGR